MAVYAARAGSAVHASDISPIAVENTNLNLQAHRMTGTVLQSDLFESFDPEVKFDTVFFNHPYGKARILPVSCVSFFRFFLFTIFPWYFINITY